MGILAYTELCQVEKEQDRQWLKEVARQFEERTKRFNGFQLPGFEPLGNRYYKRRYDKFRLVARLETIPLDERKIPVLIFLELLHRNDRNYFDGDAQLLHGRYHDRIQQAVPDIQRYLQRQDQLPPEPPLPALPPLPQELDFLLRLPESSGKEASVFLSPLWLKAAGKLITDGQRNAVYQVLEEIVYDYSQIHCLLERRAGPSVLYYTMVRDPESSPENGELCHCFLLGLACDEWPQEEQAEFKRRCRELFDDLQRHVFVQDGRQDLQQFIDQISRRAASACPAYLLADEACWSEVQSEQETFLALSAQELNVLRNLVQGKKTPCVIEGRAGSGKSTLLAYYAARRIYPQQELPDWGRKLQLLYLSENSTLVKKAETLITRLTRHRLNQLAAHQDRRPRDPFLLEPAYRSFHQFALEQLPPDRRGRFAERNISGNWIGFERFRDMLHGLRHPIARQLSAEVAWFTIRSYIKGFNIHAQDEEERWLSPEDYLNEVPRRDRQISVELYEQIWEHVWPWYKQYTVTGLEDRDVPSYWDDLDLAWEVLRFRRKDAPGYSIILCDEVQDFSRVELAAVLGALEWLQYDLSHLSRDRLRLPVVLAGDAHQTINPTCFRWARVRGDAARALVQHLPEVDVPRVESEPLTYNYRNAHTIALLCNAIQLLRQETLGMKDKLQVPWQLADEFPNQRVRRLLIDPTNQHIVQELYNRSIWLVAPEPADPEIETCREFWQRLGFWLDRRLPNVDTPATVKGMEQQFVAVIGFGELFSQMDVHDFWKWSNAAEDERIPEQKRFAMEFFLNRLYVAISRAQKQVWILETERGWKQFWEPFLQWLQPRRGTTADFCYSDGTLDELVNIDQKRWKVLAEESAKLALEQESAKHAERAAFYYQLVDDTFHARKMEAYHLRYRGKLVEGARILQKLGDLQEAARWLWEARAWNERAACDVSPQWQTDLAKLLALPHGKRDADWASRVDHLLHQTHVSRQLEQRRDTRIWATVLLDHARTVTRLAPKLPEELVRQTYHLLKQYSWLQTSSPEDPKGRHWAGCIAVLAYHLKHWQEAAQCWERAGQTQHLDYFQAKARSTDYPESLRWWESAKQWDHILRLYEARQNVPLERRDLLRVARAYEEKQQWTQVLLLVCSIHRQRAVQVWRSILAAPRQLEQPPRELVRRMFHAQDHPDVVKRHREWADLLFDLLRATDYRRNQHRPFFEALVTGFALGGDPDALAHRLDGSKRSTKERGKGNWPQFATVLNAVADQAKVLVSQFISEGHWEEAYRLTWFLMLLLWRFEHRDENKREQNATAARGIASWRTYVEKPGTSTVTYPLLHVAPLLQSAIQDALICVAQGPEDWLRNADFSMLGFVAELAGLVDAIAENLHENLQLCKRAATGKEAIGTPQWWLLVARFAEQAPLRVRAIWIYRDMLELAGLFGWPRSVSQQIRKRLDTYERKYDQWRAGDREEQPVRVNTGRDEHSECILVSRIGDKSVVIEFLDDRAQVRFLVPAADSAEPKLRFHEDEVSVRGPEWLGSEYRWMVQHPRLVIRLFWNPGTKRLTILADRRFVVELFA